MFKRYILVALSGVLFSIALCVLVLPQKTLAVGEIYSWTSYSKIGAKYGSYESMGKAEEGGGSSVEFVQDKENPNLFTAKPGTNNCKGEIKLTFSGTPNQASLSASDCSALSEADKTVTIKNSDNITVKAQSDSLKMHDAFIEKNCKTPDQETTETTKWLEDCKKTAENSYKQKSEECKNQYDYTKSPQLANKNLTCLAEKLCVDRPGEAEKQEDPKNTKQQCTIGDIGWLVCQILYLESQISDKSFELLTGFLTVDPLKEQVSRNPNSTPIGQPNQNQNPSPATPEVKNDQHPVTKNNETTVFAAWKLLLGLTNLIFIAVFLLVIFSYITSWGLSNYNIKSTLPRYIIAVLLVNLSFWICALAIDVSNVLGRTTQSFLVDLTPVSSRGSWTEITSEVTSTGATDAESGTSKASTEKESDPPADPATSNQAQTTATCQVSIPKQPDVSEDNQGEGDAKQLPTMKAKVLMIGGASIFGIAVLYVLLAVLIPLMTVALLAMVVTLILLLFRQAVIIMLVVVSPLAFALIILPNTRRWFDRWRTTFVTLLMIYPAISLIYGASYFAAHTLQDRALEYDSILMSMFALAIMVVPLFMTPALMKLGGGVMDRFAGLINNKGPISKARSWAESAQEDQKNKAAGRAATATGIKRFTPKNFVRRARIRREQGNKASTRLLNQVRAGYSAQSDATKGLKNKDFAAEAAEEASALAAGQLNDVILDRTRAVAARFDAQGYSHEDYKQMAESGRDKDGRELSDIEHAAAAQAAVNHASSEDVHDIIAASGKMGDLARRMLVENLRKNGFNKQNSHFGGSALNAVAEGKINSHADIEKLMVRAASSGAYGGESLTNQSSYTLSKLNELKSNGSLEAQGVENLQRSANMVMGDDKLSGKLDANRTSQVRGLGR